MTDKDRLGKARERGYLTASNGRWGERAHNQWYAECKTEGRPFVTMAPRVRYATVKLDMWSCDRLLSGDGIAIRSNDSNSQPQPQRARSGDGTEV